MCSPSWWGAWWPECEAAASVVKKQRAMNHGTQHISPFLIFKKIFLFYGYRCHVCVYTHVPNACSTCRDQKRVSDPLGSMEVTEDLWLPHAKYIHPNLKVSRVLAVSSFFFFPPWPTQVTPSVVSHVALGGFCMSHCETLANI